MTAAILEFPSRRAACIWLLPEGGAWLVVAKQHAWSHGSFPDALRDAMWLSKNLSMPIRMKRP